ncbi:ABC-2 type transport system ATP-binding protein [Methanolinea mesophila]|uniref:ABC transporter ATP-binding protein n=1 Tax=Methanolinea mesophila TaxID=547055 RepID=UPI001AEB7DFA|nr:ABC transporter ATP-binding protein [Methanolinea mesophila]MBP1929854.1 ABC-2 type transport system ATP-binding protein [Methanolinea mesophila]
MIEGCNLKKDFDGFVALDGISFSFERSGIFGIVGHNGAGKTTLLKILSGLIPPSSGTLTMDGIDVLKNPDAVKQVLGYLPEESRLYETMTVDDYLRFFGEIYGLPKETITSRGMELLASLNLEPDKKKIGELSKGMKRKVAIARSLIHDPSVLIFDEPTSGLDPMTSRFIVDYLRELKSAGKTIILSAHNLYQVEAICDRVMILRRGKTVADGTMPELREMFGSITYHIYFTAPRVEEVHLDRDPAVEGGFYRADAGSVQEMNAITSAISLAGGTVDRIESRYPSLEEMMIKIGE